MSSEARLKSVLAVSPTPFGYVKTRAIIRIRWQRGIIRCATPCEATGVILVRGYLARFAGEHEPEVSDRCDGHTAKGPHLVRCEPGYASR